jgi:hypothetical protein
LEGWSVRAHGGIRGKRRGVNVASPCAGEDVGLAASDDGGWNVDFGPLTRGRRLDRQRRIAAADGRRTRHRYL